MWLNDNRITSLQGLQALSQLRVLWVANNQLTKIGTALDNNGRLEESVDLSLTDATDKFELIFDTGAYWHSFGLSGSDNQIISEVVLRFSMPSKNARYHMPVILSPNSYSTWSSQPE